MKDGWIEEHHDRAELLLEINWVEVRLKDIATFINGYSFKSTDWAQEGKPIIRIQNLTGKQDIHYFNGILDEKYNIVDGDLILSWSATIDIFRYTGEDAVLNQHLFKVIPSSKVDKEFLYYIIKNNIQQLKDLSHGISMKHIKKGDVENYIVKIPSSIEHQKQIARVLADLDKLASTHSAKADVLSRIKQQLMNNKSEIIEQERQKSEQLQQYKATSADIDHKIIDICSRLPKNISDRAVTLEGTAKIIDIFTYVGEEETYERERAELLPEIVWKTSRLSDLVKLTSGSFIKKTEQDDSYPYPVYNGGITNTGMYKDYNTEGPKVIISSRGAAGYVNKVEGKFWAGNSCYVLNIIDESKLDLTFLYYIMKNNQSKLEAVKQQSAIPAINMSEVNKLEIRYPESLEHQRQIARVLADLDELSQLHSSKADILSKIKAQLMNNKSGIIEQERQKSEITSGWITVKLGDIFKLKRGYVLSKADVRDVPDDEYCYPVYSSQTMNDGIMGYYNKYLFENCITWTTDGAYAGTFKYRPGKFYCTNVCGVLTDNNNFSNTCIATLINIVAQRYVSRGGNPKLMNNVVAGIEICIPSSVDEQNHIASILENYDGLIESETQLMQIVEREREQLQKELLTVS